MSDSKRIVLHHLPLLEGAALICSLVFPTNEDASHGACPNVKWHLRLADGSEHYCSGEARTLIAAVAAAKGR